jgi:hypothetical protein
VDWVSKGLDGLLQLWERGKTLLWPLAAICAVVFAILFGGAFLGIDATAAALGSYGLWLALGAAVFGILAAVKTLESRRRPSVHLIANERQSLWGQSKERDGRRIATQLSFQMQATNLTGSPIKVSDVRLSRPWTRARVLQHVLATQHSDPAVNTYSSENQIPPRGIAQVHCHIILDRPVGRAGQPLTAVIKVSDQFGRWHKVKFRLIDPSGASRR